MASYFSDMDAAAGVIYEKAYSKFDSERAEELAARESLIQYDDDSAEDSELSNDRFGEYMRKNIRMKELPGRVQGQEKFIALAKELSEAFALSIRICRESRCISVSLSLDFNQRIDGRLNRLIGMADGITVSPGYGKRDVVIALNYAVLGIYNKDKLIFPECLAE